MYTIDDGELQTRDVLVADGSRREVSGEGCEGWESVEFSDDGRRVFSRSEFTCAETGVQTGTGVMSFVSPTHWVDVRSMNVNGEDVAWVQRYALVPDERAAAEGVEDPTFGVDRAARNARMAASLPIDLEDVEEATRRADAKAVEAWVAETRDGFDLSADELVRLADSGVPGSVIDVVVAVSYPERFQIADAQASRREASRVGGDLPPRARRPIGWGPRMGFSSYWDPFYMGYGYGYIPYGANSFGYYGCGFGGYCGYVPTRVIVRPREPEPRGRMVPGVGYTRGGDDDSRGSAGSRSRGSGGASAAPARGSGDPSRDDPPPRRTARPRGPGGA
jgi:hypothetical protein